MDTKGLLQWVQRQESLYRNSVIHGIDGFTSVVIRTLVYLCLLHMQFGAMVRWGDRCLQLSRERLTATLLIVEDQLVDLWLSVIPINQACVIRDISRPAQASVCVLPLSVYKQALEGVYAGYPVPHFFSAYVWLRVIVHTFNAKTVIRVVFVEAQHRWVITENPIASQKSLLAALLWLHNEAYWRFHSAGTRRENIKIFCYPPSISVANELRPYVK